MWPMFVNLIIIVILALYAYDGWRRGFILLTLELLGTFLIVYAAFIFATPVGTWLVSTFNFPSALNQLIGFVAVWLALQTLYVAGSTWLYPSIPKVIRHSFLNRLLGTIPSMGKGLVTTAVFATLLVALPIENQVRPAVLSSQLGQPLVVQTQALEQRLLRRYNAELTQTLTFLTNTPLSRKIEDPTESVVLYFKTSAGQDDPASEATLLRLVNAERAKVDAKPLRTTTKLRDIGRVHARNMLERGYFAHNTPEGKSPFDRLDTAGVSYTAAGENLAFASTVELAHLGLMNSPGHRANILDPDFGEVGMAVIDAGVYGKMFVQEFTD